MYSITKNGQCAKHLCVIDEVNRTVSTTEDGLVFNFDLSGWIFKTGSYCTFKAGGDCTFYTGDNCTFNTGSKCTFATSYNCTFNTGYGCVFYTGNDCTFNTGSDCTFNTDDYCTFDTGSHCTFDTGYDCTFKTGGDCTFKVGEKCVLVRNDIYEEIELPVDKMIKLNGCQVKGYTFVKKKKTITLELDEKQIESLRQQGFDIK